MINPTLSAWLPVFLWAGLIFTLSAIPSLKTSLGIWDLILRKCAHVVEYAILAGLLLRAFKRTWPLWSTVKTGAWVFGVGVLYAISDEFHQSFVPGRGPSVRDVVLDSFGVSLVLLAQRFR